MPATAPTDTGRQHLSARHGPCQPTPTDVGVAEAASPWAELTLSGPWWREEHLVAARVADFVGGFNTVEALPIPYARLPRRWSLYTHEFPCWSDIAGQTIQSLLDRPKLGESAIRALIDIARECVRATRKSPTAEEVDAAEAVATLLGRLDDFDRGLLSRRRWTWAPTPAHLLTAELGRSLAAISRSTPRAVRRFQELVDDPAHRAVSQHASRLRQRLGPYTPLTAAEAELTSLGLDPDSVAAHVLLEVAGPYALDQGWIQNTADDGKARAAAAVDAAFAEQPAAAPHLLIEALTALGMAAPVAEEYLQTHERLRRFGEVCVRWRGDTVANMVEDILHVLNAPATAEAIHALLDPRAMKLSTVNYALSNDDRFVRASRSRWGLAAWGGRQYRGIAHAIGERIDAHGGAVSVDVLTAELVHSYPDISEESVRSYLSTLAFIVRGGVARRRRRGDRWPKIPPLNTVSGVFRNGDNELRIAFPVDAELLRGSGQHVHRAVATAAGVRPGRHRTFSGRAGSLTLRWDIASTRGPDIGSLRALAAAVDATNGDHLVVVLHPRGRTLAAAARVRPTDDARVQLESLLGHRVDDAAASFGHALDCPPADAADLLRGRGDRRWANIIQ